jgi:hypothetical protein
MGLVVKGIVRHNLGDTYGLATTLLLKKIQKPYKSIITHLFAVLFSDFTYFIS